jgi:hypothetical protein
MILLVCVAAAIGSTCPLTSLESTLRLRDNEAGYPSDFIGYWLDRLIFYDASAWVFIVVYFTFATLVLLTFWLVPMRPRKTILRRQISPFTRGDRRTDDSRSNR